LTGLTKGQVRRIAAALNGPESLVHKVPTADLEELAPGKPDEDAHGVPYEKIDAFLLGKPVDDAAAQTIIKQYDMTEHKRQLPLAP
jgi:NAD+ synthase